MTTDFFCAAQARAAQEDPIGTASVHQIYVLSEFAPPWTEDAFASRSVPVNWRAAVEEGRRARLVAVRPLLIYNGALQQLGRMRVILLHLPKGPAAGYDRRECLLRKAEDVAPLVREYLSRPPGDCERTTADPRDLLVCTHGSHDKCCARYGYPFFREAQALVSELGLRNVRLWQTTHFGGHRFAPTLIDFPSGRYYGNLDRRALASILTRSGDIGDLKAVYRGWGILPGVAQVLERELLLLHGWNWLDNEVHCERIEGNPERSRYCIELAYRRPDGVSGRYRAQLVEDPDKTRHLKGSCNNPQVYTYTKYCVKHLERL
ncbi:MAG: sucrase ferredoxin [Aphanocapsa lilacina HA4352-LM1]|jgi:hypothetical protein|nr:sucrase ferredoxin [Aphanocapsa lilacina HA4352-LM1]